MKRQAMAQQFTVVTLDDMEKFLNRGFRALRPRQHALRGEVVIDLHLNDAKTVGVRVWTSIPAGGMEGARLGEDAILVQFFNFRRNHPLIKGKAPIVKRTQNWRDNLNARIGDYMQEYDTDERYWDSLAGS